MSLRFCHWVAFAAIIALFAGLATPAPAAPPVVKKQVQNIGFKMSYTEAGSQDAEAVIFLHGFTDSSYSWSMTAPLLAGEYRIFALDLRGFGDSERPEWGYTIPQFAEDVVAFMDALQIKQATLIGHSMGTFVAHQIGWVYPERVKKLVLVSSAMTCVRNATLMDVYKTVGASSFRDPISSDFIRAWQTGPNPVSEDFFSVILQETAKPPARVWKAALRGLLGDDHGAFLKNIAAPTLIIWGDKDTCFLRADQDSLLKAIPGAVLKVHNGAGHNVQWEKGRDEELAKDIRAFLKKK